MCSSTQSASVALPLHFLQDSLQVKRCGFLPLWEVFEGLKELSHDCLRREHDPELIGIPTLEHLRIRRYFKWILPEVNHQRHGPRVRNIGKPRVFNRKVDFPIAVSNRIEAAGIVEEENFLSLT